MHAHLSGSVRDSTVLDLLKEEQLINNIANNNDGSDYHNNQLFIEEELNKSKVSRSKSLEECFKYFAILHRLLNSKKTLSRITKEGNFQVYQIKKKCIDSLLENKLRYQFKNLLVLEDFSSENCIYLELRTTPRNVYKQNENVSCLLLSKKDYVETILNEIRLFEKTNKNMTTRLILSIDRSKSLEDALETVELCKQLNDEYIVGIDFSGNPLVSSLKEFEKIFTLIKQNNWKTTV